MFSKACGYGIRGTLHIAQQSKKGMRSKIGEISRAVNSPEAYTAKIMQKLVKNEVIESKKSPFGEFFIAHNSRTKLIDIMFTIDGDAIYNGCGLELAECTEAHPCPLHDEFVSIQAELKQMLNNTEIMTLAGKLDSGFTFLKL